MTINEAISRLESLREEFGGDTPFCIEAWRLSSGFNRVYSDADFELHNVAKVDGGARRHWVISSEDSDNKNKIVAAW